MTYFNPFYLQAFVSEVSRRIHEGLTYQLIPTMGLRSQYPATRLLDSSYLERIYTGQQSQNQEQKGSYIQHDNGSSLLFLIDQATVSASCLSPVHGPF
jgi:hypothetical protein